MSASRESQDTLVTPAGGATFVRKSDLDGTNEKSQVLSAVPVRFTFARFTLATVVEHLAYEPGDDPQGHQRQERDGDGPRHYGVNSIPDAETTRLDDAPETVSTSPASIVNG